MIIKQYVKIEDRVINKINFKIEVFGNMYGLGCLDKMVIKVMLFDYVYMNIICKNDGNLFFC